jgi:hypothetical protein
MLKYDRKGLPVQAPLPKQRTYSQDPKNLPRPSRKRTDLTQASIFASSGQNFTR